jgi:chemotaxis protein histidine kinase CheA
VDSAQYAELFLTESREHVSAINHSLLELERGAGGDEPVGAIFRAVHTIKGMSATMGYTPVATLSHELETLLDRVRRGVRTIDARLMQLLFRAADVLEGAIEAAVGGQATSGDVDPVVALLRLSPQTPPRRGRASRASEAAAPRGRTSRLAGRPRRPPATACSSACDSPRGRRSLACAPSSWCRRRARSVR